MVFTDVQIPVAGGPTTDASILFQGVDTVQAVTRSTAVAGEYQTVGSESSQLLKLCVDFQSLSESTDITQSASVGVGLFGVSEKVQFVKQTDRTTWSINLMIRSTKVRGTHLATSYRLADGVTAPQTDENKINFFRRYGDSFISSLTLGAEYIAIFTIFLNSESEHQSTMAELSAHGLTSAFSFDAGLQSKVSSFFQKTSARVNLRQQTFGVGSIALPGLDTMIEFARTFPTLEIDQPSIVRLSTTGYENLLPTGTFEPIAFNRNYFVGTSFANGVYTDGTLLTDLSRQLDAINAIHDTYGFSDPKIKTVKDQTTKDLAALSKQMETFGKDPLTVFPKPGLPSLAEGVPSVNFERGESDAWGGNNTGPFDDVGKVGDFISKCARISSVRFHTGDYVTGLVVTYQGADDTTSVRKVHGQEKDTAGYELFLENDDRIIEVSGRAGLYVDQMVIKTAAGHTVTGGNTSGGGGFRWTAEDGRVLLGFRGRSGSFLDQIQVVWAKLLPVKWKQRF